MALFPRFAQEVSPLFRLLEDYDRQISPNRHSIRAWGPKFDVKEVDNAYELHGELPGVDQKDINIEWTDSNTITISGQVEHRHEEIEPAQGRIEEADNHEYKKPSVEEEAGTSQAAGETTVAKINNNTEVGKPTKTPKYWVTERSVGEFHRSFSFPGRVEHDTVKASLKNGILSIVVPKAQKPVASRINIE